MSTDDRVTRALAGELASEELTPEEAQLYDAEVAKRLHDRLRTVDMSLSENQSIEPVSDVSVTPSGDVTLTRLDGDVRSVSLDGTMSSEQAWFWTAEVQQAVTASERELDAGDSEVYSSGGEFLASLADPEA
ncbi:hypothetical protein [Gordonia sp. p3-SID1431]|uniref:hypothetical protein n=1 Tax=Gordonia sp. p3-SID1431 TaxID=2916159 RepID=UPI0021A5E049|nr:hypothetical protein [Gordonia sp. p3-SID1431]MCT1356298.1 hypothetical protein [Gordonia sp. p3-SID1431]